LLGRITTAERRLPLIMPSRPLGGRRAILFADQRGERDGGRHHLVPLISFL
jgi:hypothetical protein